MSYGGFVGYNVQWDDVIIGVDVNYNRSSFARRRAGDADPSRRQRRRQRLRRDSRRQRASMRITDYGAARVRAGWIVGNFLPYATVGVAVGRADVTRSAHVYGAETRRSAAIDRRCRRSTSPTSDGKNGAFIYGWAAGGGIDMMVMPNLFVRGEFEYIWFTKLQGIKSQHCAPPRVGAGFEVLTRLRSRRIA